MMIFLAQTLEYLLYASLAIHVGLIALCAWRLRRPGDVMDRLVIAELIATLILALLVLLAIIDQQRIYIDVVMGLAAMGFVGMIALAKYIADQQMF
jgi:multisubunit Na+/H+ antiporter MnhF subunit